MNSNKLNLIRDLKEAQRRVIAVNNCPRCQKLKEQIKEHETKGHKE